MVRRSLFMLLAAAALFSSACTVQAGVVISFALGAKEVLIPTTGSSQQALLPNLAAALTSVRSRP